MGVGAGHSMRNPRSRKPRSRDPTPSALPAFRVSIAPPEPGFLSSTAGAFTLDTNGNVTSGLQDFNNNGSSLGATGLAITSGSVSLATAPGIASLTTTAGTFTFDVYPVDATHLKFVEIDSLPILAGDVFTGVSSIPAGANAFNVAGYDFSIGGPFAAAGLIITDGTSTITSASTEDINDAGNPFQVTSFGGSYTALSGGRSVLTLNGFANGNSGLTGNYQFAAYPSSGGLVMLEIDNAGITSGIAYPQTSTTLASDQGYGFNLTGENTSSEEDDVAEFTNTNGTFAGLIDFNDQGQTTANQNFGSVYTADSTIPGRGLIAPTKNAFNLVSYVVDDSTSIFVEVDNNQVALGSFGLQTPSTKSNLAAMQLVALRQKPGAKNARRRKNDKKK